MNPRLLLPAVDFCEMYPTYVSSKLSEFFENARHGVCHGKLPSALVWVGIQQKSDVVEHRGRGATTSMFLHWKCYIGYSSNTVYKTEKYHQRLSEFYAQWRHGTWWWRCQDQTGKPNTSQAGLKISSTSSRPTVAAQKQHQQHVCSDLTQAVQEKLQTIVQTIDIH